MAKFFGNLFYYLSPFSILIVSSFILQLVRDPYHTERWTNQLGSLFLPLFFLLGFCYLLLRMVLGDRVLLIWLVEICIMMVIYGCLGW